MAHNNYANYYTTNPPNYQYSPSVVSNWTLENQKHTATYSGHVAGPPFLVPPPPPPNLSVPPPNYSQPPPPPPPSVRPPYFNNRQSYVPPRYTPFNNQQPQWYRNNYKKTKNDGPEDQDTRPKSNKKRKKPLSQNIPAVRTWSIEDARIALEVEKECNKLYKNVSLVIKFPDEPVNREIVAQFHPSIANVHFQQPSTPRFCFVTLADDAHPDKVISILNNTRFGNGYLTAEIKKDREEDQSLSPEDIDPLTLYVGNLAQDITKKDMEEAYPNHKRIDIGYAKKMKYTRYAFVSFRTVQESIEAFKKTHSTQMYSKSLIVRFRRLHGTVGMPGEIKVQNPPRTSESDKHDTMSTASDRGTNYNNHFDFASNSSDRLDSVSYNSDNDDAWSTSSLGYNPMEDTFPDWSSHNEELTRSVKEEKPDVSTLDIAISDSTESLPGSAEALNANKPIPGSIRVKKELKGETCEKNAECDLLQPHGVDVNGAQFPMPQVIKNEAKEENASSDDEDEDICNLDFNTIINDIQRTKAQLKVFKDRVP